MRFFPKRDVSPATLRDEIGRYPMAGTLPDPGVGELQNAVEVQFLLEADKVVRIQLGGDKES